MPRRYLNGANQLLKSGSRPGVESDSAGLDDIEHAKKEIARLKRELALAREELEDLTEATSDFVRLML